ncbi:MAG: ATP-binding protein [Gemmatimonadaceae bacterium]
MAGGSAVFHPIILSIGGLHVRTRFADLPIGGKILTGYGLIAGLMLVTIVYGLVSLARMETAQSELLRLTDVRKAARTLDVDVLGIIVSLQSFVDTRDPALLSDLEGRRKDSDALRAQIRAATRRPATLAALDAYERILPLRRQLADRLIAAARSDAPLAQVGRLRSERRELDDHARSFLREIIEDQDSATAKQQQITHQRAFVAKRNMTAVSLGAVALMLALSFAITRSIIGPIRKLQRMTEQVGKGDFAIQNEVESRDEIGAFARALNAMAADVAKLDRAKDEFIGLASHQLRTPATAVKNYIGLLKEGYAGALTEEQQTYVDQAWESNEQQLAIVDSLLRVARTDSGMVSLKRRVIDLHPMVVAVIEQQRATLDERRQRCRLYAPRLPTHAFVDAEFLPMAIENLLSNASKYTEPGGRILVALTGTADSACISVRDNGVGIAAADIPRLFGKFSRIPNSMSTPVAGHGIGLYLTKRIIDLHKGQIHVDSRLDKGTTFTIRLTVKAE